VHYVLQLLLFDLHYDVQEQGVGYVGKGAPHLVPQTLLGIGQTAALIAHPVEGLQLLKSLLHGPGGLHLAGIFGSQLNGRGGQDLGLVLQLLVVALVQRFQLQVEDIAFGFKQLLSVLRTNGLNVCGGLRTAN